MNLAGDLSLHPLHRLTNSVLALFVVIIKKCPLQFTKNMSTNIHPRRGHSLSTRIHQKCPKEFTKSVHENSRSKNVHYSPILKKKSVHERSKSPSLLGFSCGSVANSRFNYEFRSSISLLLLSIFC